MENLIPSRYLLFVFETQKVRHHNY